VPKKALLNYSPQRILSVSIWASRVWKVAACHQYGSWVSRGLQLLNHAIPRKFQRARKLSLSINIGDTNQSENNFAPIPLEACKFFDRADVTGTTYTRKKFQPSTFVSLCVCVCVCVRKELFSSICPLITVRSETCCALRLRYVDLVVSIDARGHHF
jgi:hypothetical protein